MNDERRLMMSVACNVVEILIDLDCMLIGLFPA